MAVDCKDHASGFQYTEVVKFINNEILMNGGGPEFYESLCSRPWKEIEDRLHTVLVDPNLSRSQKRSCAWSALALSVRIIARQRVQHSRRVELLQDQVGERDTASKTLSSELQRLQEERDQAAVQLLSTQTALQKAMDEREILLGRLLQAERSARCDAFPQDTPEHRREQYKVVAGSVGQEEQVDVKFREQQNMPHLGVQMPVPATLPYALETPGPFMAKLSPILPSPRIKPVQHNTKTLVGYPYSAPVPCPVVACPVALCPRVMESRTPVATSSSTLMPHIPPAGTYSSRRLVAVGSQEAMGQGRCLLGDNINYSRDDPVKTQRPSPSGDTGNNSFKDQLTALGSRKSTRHLEKRDGLVRQKRSALKINTSHSVKKDSGFPQGMTARGSSTSCSIKKDLLMPHRMANQGDNIKYCHKKYAVISQGKTDLGNGTNQSQKDQIMSQGTDVLWDARSQSQKNDPIGAKESPLGKNKSSCLNKCPKVEQKAKPPQTSKTSETKQQKKCTSQAPSMIWVCPLCHTLNHSWQKSCYKCTHVCISTESQNIN
uniref:testis-expressed protein 13D n=1 Tax=Jaculus jaculus TaxID=51337 RepID=UPI001E1B0E21|nr:testis-expressed protein 13D [Jaculus jaculus]